MASCKLVIVLLALVKFSYCSSGCLVNINKSFEESLERLNKRNQEDGHTYLEKREGEIGNITFNGFTLLGLDSLTRTDDCSVETATGRSAYKLHLGLGLLQFFFKILSVNGDSFSASVRIERNSLFLGYTIYNATEKSCSVKVDNLMIEEAWGIVLYAAHPKYSGEKIDEFFNDHVMPQLNENLIKDKSIMEGVLERKYCGIYRPENEAQSLLSSVLHHIIYHVEI